MIFKRTGWFNIWYENFVEVLPQDDLKEHYTGDECWCNPKTEIVEDGDPPILITHNSADRRELYQNKT